MSGSLVPRCRVEVLDRPPRPCDACLGKVLTRSRETHKIALGSLRAPFGWHNNLRLLIMQDSARVQSASAPFDDPDADLVLRTSDNTTFHIHSLFMRKASPVFRDMISVPQPSIAGAEAAEYVDGKPLVRVTEDKKTMDAFLHCCYPVARPVIDISQLAAVYAAGDKYDVDAVKNHVLSELSRYTLQPRHSLGAYVLACHFGLPDEVKRAARQTLDVPKEDILFSSILELRLIPASSLTHLLRYRERCLYALSRLFTVPSHILEDHDGDGRIPLWERYCEAGPDCSCDVSYGEMDGGDPHSDDEDSGYDEDAFNINDDARFSKYWVKRWCARYMNTMAGSLREDRLKVPIRDALKDRDALAQALTAASQCASCGQKCVKEFLLLLKEIDDNVEDTISWVRFIAESSKYIWY
ncbi:hypothetical protein NM688_g5780 [Phlebia brevispora]|uniref:Uncharacterized protein n=1 Tax=Phlebia brevispora TaxID=194682 RepID=A0ACC1SQ51_9APHY|nr:hypothetical protein NM688_g5780 [Phlebia brevispora]